jgi:hypothetical protein
MASYENGKIPADLLRPVSNFRPLTSRVNENVGSNLLRQDARDALTLLQVAFLRAVGHTLYVSEAYRGLTLQTAYYRDYQAGVGNLAAVPGTSNHGWGISCDFGSGVGTYGSVAKNWMDAHAPAYGWHPEGNSFPRREGWHFLYKAGTATITPASSGAVVIDPSSPSNPGTTPATPIPEEAEVTHIIYQAIGSKTDRTLLFDLTTRTAVLISADEAAAHRAGGVKFVADVNQGWFDSIVGPPDAPTVRVMGFDPTQVTRIQGAVMDLADDRAPRFSIIFGTISGQAAPYMLDAADGKRRAMTPVELSVWRASDAKISETTINQADFDNIPKR